MVALRSGDNLRQIRGSGRSRLRKSAGARRFLCTARRLLPRLSAAAKRRKGESALTPLVTMATAKSCPLPVPSSQIWRLLASAGFCWPHCWPRRCTRPVACDTSDMHAKCSTMRRDILAATCVDRVATVAAPLSAQHAEKATEVSARARHDGAGHYPCCVSHTFTPVNQRPANGKLTTPDTPLPCSVGVWKLSTESSRRWR